MTDLRKAAQQALEIMDGLTDWNHNAVGNNMRLRAASTALREALAKPAVPEIDTTSCKASDGTNGCFPQDCRWPECKIAAASQAKDKP